MKRALLALTLSAVVTGCALDQQSTPSLTGPSELGVSMTLTASPDVLLQNGAAQSTVTAVVRDGSGKPLSGRLFYVRSRVGSTFNVGTLSASSATTDSQGRASVVFTAPAADAGNFSSITIEMLPVGSADGWVRSISILMVRPS